MSFSERRDVRIEDICRIRRGSSPRPIHEYISESGIPWVKISDATSSNSRYIYATKEFIKDEGKEKSRYIQKGTLILSNSATPGIPKFMGIDACVHDGWLIVDEYRGINKWFLYYTFINERERLLNLSNGSVFRNLKTDIVKNYIVQVPPLNEQKAIAKILSSLDEKIELNNQINKTLEEMAQAIFKQWFVNFEFPNEDGEPYKSSGGEMVESELGMIPEGWEVVHLKDKLNFERGIEPGSKNYSKTYFERSIPFYRVGDMLGIAQNYVDKNLINDKTLERRDVAVSFDGTVGRVVTGLRGSYSTGIRKIYAKKGEYFPNCFIYFLFKTEFIQSTIMQYASGTTILHASESIEYLAIPYHEEIIKKFVLIIEAIFNTIVNKKKENESLSNTRDILLPKLMSGEIRVPMDEECDAS